MLIECKNCLAPLEAAPQESSITCRYCGFTSRTERRSPLFQWIGPPMPFQTWGVHPHRALAATQPTNRRARRRNERIVLGLIVAYAVAMVAIVVLQVVSAKDAPRREQRTSAVPTASPEEEVEAPPEIPRVGKVWLGTRFHAPIGRIEDPGPRLEPYVADVDIDETEDIVGLVSGRGDDAEIHVAAVDGETFEVLWTSPSLGFVKAVGFDGRDHALVAFDGRYVVASGGKHSVLVLTRSSGRVRHELHLREEIEALCARSDGVVIDLKNGSGKRLDPKRGTLTPVGPVSCRPSTPAKPKVAQWPRPDDEPLQIVRVVMDGGRAYALANQGRTPRPVVLGFDPATGSVSWEREIELPHPARRARHLDELSVHDGSLFVESASEEDGRFILELTPSTGVPVWTTPIGGGYQTGASAATHHRYYLVRGGLLTVIERRPGAKRGVTRKILGHIGY